MPAKHFYITTPIYYANDRPHIGHAYTTILADVLTRYHRLLGYETFFLTGTDEHGQKVQQAAAARGVTPQQQVDEYHQRFKDLWQKLNIAYDRFIRTTDADHVAFVQKSLQELHDRGEIYEEVYAGWYSVGEERFFADDELVDGKDPISGKPVDWIEEKNYFFKMSKYQDALIRHIEENPRFIQPDFRKNEVLGFLRQPLHDLCISRPRSRLAWGIPLPFDQDFVTYVWFDALLNYQTGVLDRRFSDGSDPWPADYHIIGKDILTTHAVYWPTMLMGMGRTLPRHILAHGWWLMPRAPEENAATRNFGPDFDDGFQKMSKSKGNVVDPLSYAEEYGVDVLRYFLMRDMVLGQDAAFSHELFVSRVNTDLANDLGNAINRVNKFVLSNLDGILGAPAPEIFASEIADTNEYAEERALRDIAQGVVEKSVTLLVGEMKLSFALEEIAGLVRAVNRYLEKRAPWKVAKDPDPRSAVLLASILYTAAEALRIALSLLFPVMPDKARLGLTMLGVEREPDESDLVWGVLKGGERLTSRGALFPRIESEAPAGTEATHRSGAGSAKQRGAGPHGQAAADQGAQDPASKLEFRVARIVSVADHPDADGLYVLTLDTGSEAGDGIGQEDRNSRTVCAGLKSSYTPEQLGGRTVVLFANLKPAKLRGVESRGMLLAADLPDGRAALLEPGEIPVGTVLQFADVAVTPKSKVSLKDFEKLALRVHQGRVRYGTRDMGSGKNLVRATAPDGAAVH